MLEMGGMMGGEMDYAGDGLCWRWIMLEMDYAGDGLCWRRNGELSLWVNSNL
jgi:hypothetical protein